MKITHKMTNEKISKLKSIIDSYHDDINKLDIIKNIYDDDNDLPDFVVYPLISAVNKVNLIYDLLSSECILIDANSDIPEMENSEFVKKYLLVDKDESGDEKFFVYRKYTPIGVQSRSRLFDYLVAVRKFTAALRTVNAYVQLMDKKMKVTNKDKNRLFDLVLINYFNSAPMSKLDKMHSKIKRIVLSDIFGYSVIDIINKEISNSISK